MKILVAILIVFFGYHLAFATTCATWVNLSDKEHSEKLREIDAIFYGKIISINKPTDNSNNSMDYTQILQVKVLRAWKGVEASEISVLYIRSYWFSEMKNSEVGTEMLFYARKSEDNELVIGSCSFRAFDDERMMREYGEGKVIEHLQPIETTEGFWSSLWKKIVSFFS